MRSRSSSSAGSVRAELLQAGLHHGEELQVARRHRPGENRRAGRAGRWSAARNRPARRRPISCSLRHRRLRVLEMHLLRRPARPAALADDVEEHAERQLGVLPALDDCRRGDLVFEPDQPVRSSREPHHRAFLVIAEEADQVLERRAERRRGDRRIAPHAEVARLELVAEPQAEIVVAGLAGRFLEELDEGAERSFSVGEPAISGRMRASPKMRSTSPPHSSMKPPMPVAAEARTPGACAPRGAPPMSAVVTSICPGLPGPVLRRPGRRCLHAPCQQSRKRRRSRARYWPTTAVQTGELSAW